MSAFASSPPEIHIPIRVYARSLAGPPPNSVFSLHLLVEPVFVPSRTLGNIELVARVTSRLVEMVCPEVTPGYGELCRNWFASILVLFCTFVGHRAAVVYVVDSNRFVQHRHPLSQTSLYCG